MLTSISQDAFNLIASSLAVNDIRYLSYTCRSIKKKSKAESLWKLLFVRDYPTSFRMDESYFNTYWTEYRQQNCKTYVWMRYFGGGPTYTAPDESNRFETKEAAIKDAWCRFYKDKPINPKLHKISPNLVNLREYFMHQTICEICDSKDPLGFLEHYYISADSFCENEDITYKECLDLMEDYIDELYYYEQTISQVLASGKSIIEVDFCYCWEVWIEERKGI